jgi:hypothetical protein
VLQAGHEGMTGNSERGHNKMIGMSQIMEVHNTVRADPVGSCIYCGVTGGLTEEHTIPLALGGRFILPDASCSKCAAITSAFERRVLRGFMLDARTAGRYRTRRPKERPKSLPLQVERDGLFEKIALEPTDHPGLLHLPLLEPAGLLVGRDPTLGVSVCGWETLYFGKHPTDVATGIGVKTIRTTSNWDVSSFARLLAKIGYSHAVATVGLLPREHILFFPLSLARQTTRRFGLARRSFNYLSRRRGLHMHLLTLGSLTLMM